MHPNDHPLDSDLVEIDSARRVTGFHSRPHPQGRFFQNLVNAGIYVLERGALEPWVGSHGPVDFGKDLFPAMLKRGVPLQGYPSSEYIKDIGTPERYDRVCAEAASGIVQRSSLATPQRAVFLDRDGTLVKEAGAQGLVCPEQLELLPGVPQAIRRLNQAGLRTIVVTNQPVLAKGFCTEAGLRSIHNKLETLLGGEGAFLDRICFCPHHPGSGFPGERPELKGPCSCRKPATGMIQLAAAELNLDLAQSWLIGDTTTDIQTAINAGLPLHPGADRLWRQRRQVQRPARFYLRLPPPRRRTHPRERVSMSRPSPQGFGVRQSSGAFRAPRRDEAVPMHRDRSPKRFAPNGTRSVHRSNARSQNRGGSL